MVGKPVPNKPNTSPESTGQKSSDRPSVSKAEESRSTPTNRNAPSEMGGASAAAADILTRQERHEKRARAAVAKAAQRLVSLDAFRGFIMMMLAASGFGVLAFSRIDEASPVWQTHNREFWLRMAFHFDHPAWISSFEYFKVSFWDLIQPSFMFMVGVAMPFSAARREIHGQSSLGRAFHAIVRAIVLVLLGVFLSSKGTQGTTWVFPNVLCQIGFGYFFAWLLLNFSKSVQIGALVLILVGYWGWFYFNPPAADYDYAAVDAQKEKGEILEGKYSAWSKNANAAFLFDQWLLPRLRSAPIPVAPETPAAPVEPKPEGAVKLVKLPAGDITPEVVDVETKRGWTTVALNVSHDEKTAGGDTPKVDSSDDSVNAEPASDASKSSEPVAEPGSTSEPTVPDATAADSPAAAEETSEPAETAGPGWFRRAFFSNPEPYTFNGGGYTTLNFIPSIGTTILGLLCGQLLQLPGPSRWSKLGVLILIAGSCLGLGILADQTICPVVKRIWTPSWVLFSGGYVIGILALFYLLFDVLPFRVLAFPLVVVGMNSILIYMMGQMIAGWVAEKIVKTHLAGAIENTFGPKALDPQWYGAVTLPTATFLVFWLFLLWLYRQRIFLRI